MKHTIRARRAPRAIAISRKPSIKETAGIIAGDIIEGIITGLKSIFK